MKRRVAAVGLNKTGTRSLDYLFRKLGYKTIHEPRTFSPLIHKMFLEGKSIFDNDVLKEVEFMSDLFFPSNFPTDPYLTSQKFRCEVIKALNREKVRFVINIRNMEDRIASRRRFIKKNTKKKRQQGYAMPKIDEEQWREAHRLHYEFLSEFMKNKDHIWIRLCEGDNPQRLLDWLDLDIKMGKYPWIGTLK